MPLHRARRQVFVPKEVLQAAGLNDAQFLALEAPAKLQPVIAALTALGREHFSKADEAIGSLEKQYRAAFLLLTICKLVFNRADKNLGKIAFEPMQISPLNVQWHMLLRSLRV
jgi:phytoene synthase